jgi:hypothetical protein
LRATGLPSPLAGSPGLWKTGAGPQAKERPRLYCTLPGSLTGFHFLNPFLNPVQLSLQGFGLAFERLLFQIRVIDLC